MAKLNSLLAAALLVELSCVAVALPERRAVAATTADVTKPTAPTPTSMPHTANDSCYTFTETVSYTGISEFH